MPMLKIGPEGPELKSGNIRKRPPQGPRPRQEPPSESAAPYFSGKAEEWPEFRRYFHQLTMGTHFPPGIMMAEIREHLLTKEANSLIAGKTDPTEAWVALDERYGDKELALVHVRYKLASLDMSKGEGYKKVENLLQGVNEARATLEAVGVEAELFNNVSVVAQLVSKLSGSHQDRWHQDQTSNEFWIDMRKPGEKFLAWLER